jgi:hypothetical protein
MKNPILFVVVFLAGCGVGLTQAEKDALTPEQQIFKLANEANIAFTPAVAYALQPKCTDAIAVACHDPKVVKIFLTLREEANAALATARAAPDTAALSVLTGVVRRVLSELQSELLKVKTQGASHDRRNIVAIG